MQLERTILPISILMTFVAAAAGCVDAADDELDAPVDEAALVIHPDDDVAGSQVQLHEGTDGPAIVPHVAQTPGMDVSGYQGSVSWATAYARGARFAYVKATEGTGYQNPSFAQQYNGSYNAGLIRGAYHFALPNVSSGAAQANYFLAHGGGWSRDGKTLPPALDLEYNPYGATCYGKSPSAMVAWIHDFANTMKAHTGRDIVFYTSTSWWNQCTGHSTAFSANPLWIPRYGSSVGTLPASWSFQTIWQDADHGTFPGDHDLFNGAVDRVRAFAL